MSFEGVPFFVRSVQKSNLVHKIQPLDEKSLFLCINDVHNDPPSPCAIWNTRAGARVLTVYRSPISVDLLPNVRGRRNVIAWVGAMREERVSCLDILPDRKLRRGDVAPFLLRTKFISLRTGGI